MTTRRVIQPVRPAAKPAGTQHPATRSSTVIKTVQRHELSNIHTEDTLLTRVFAEGQEPAHVRVMAGLTVNQGNYEFLRIDVSVSLPCLPTEVEAAYAKASDYVAEFISEEESRWTAPSSTAPSSTARG